MLSTVTPSAVLAASDNGVGELSPYAVGGIALGILLLAVIILLSFAGGREHS